MRGVGACSFYETATSRVWWVVQENTAGEAVGEFIEIGLISRAVEPAAGGVPAPGIALLAPLDSAASADAARAAIPLDQSDGQRGAASRSPGRPQPSGLWPDGRGVPAAPALVGCRRHRAARRRFMQKGSRPTSCRSRHRPGIRSFLYSDEPVYNTDEDGTGGDGSCGVRTGPSGL